MQRLLHRRTRTALAAACLTLAGFAGVSATASASTDWLDLRVLNVAHQGGEDEAPSNTMYAYERALRLGSDMLELDIHTSKDGRLVVIHDATVDRTTDGSGRVYDMTLAEIQALDAGYDFVPGEGTASDRPESDYRFRGVRSGERKPPPAFRPRDFRIPTLGEVLRAYPEVPTNIEIKGASDGDAASYNRNAEALARFLNRLGRTEGLMVASFNDAALARFHQLAPQIDLAPAVASVAAYKLANVPPPPGTKAFQVPLEFQGVAVADEEFIDRAHGDGYGVHVWTINDEDEMRQLLDWDADGIMTAEVARLEKVLCEERAPRPPRPAGAPGRHCSEKASIACDVAAEELRLDGRRAVLSLERADQFDSRCAGRVIVKSAGMRRTGSFSFGWLPPEAGGPAGKSVTVRLTTRMARRIRERDLARVAAHPYGAFVERTRLTPG